MRKNTPVDHVCEMEPQLIRDAKMESRILKAWAAYAKKIEEHRIKPASQGEGKAVCCSQAC